MAILIDRICANMCAAEVVGLRALICYRKESRAAWRSIEWELMMRSMEQAAKM